MQFSFSPPCRDTQTKYLARCFHAAGGQFQPTFGAKHRAIGEPSWCYQHCSCSSQSIFEGSKALQVGAELSKRATTAHESGLGGYGTNTLAQTSRGPGCSAVNKVESLRVTSKIHGALHPLCHLHMHMHHPSRLSASSHSLHSLLDNFCTCNKKSRIPVSLLACHWRTLV